MNSTPASNSKILSAGPLKVEFVRSGDRYGHQVFWHRLGGGGILMSQVGLPDDIWPPSPVLQSLHFEIRSDESQTAMLVGMAGRSHWSMSVEADPKQNRLLFDVACRVQDPPVWLGSCYDSFNQHGRAWPLDCISIMAWHGGQPGQEILVQADRSAGTVRIPATIAIHGFPQTIRWRYAVQILE
jgi:hypothetical protein